MIRSSLLTEIFNTNCIHRWNDKLRPIDLVELDFQAHRMMIAYFLGNFEEHDINFRWIDVVENGVFDLLETSVLTDLRWNVKGKLKRDPNRREKLDEYVALQLKPLLSDINIDLYNKFNRHQRRKTNMIAHRLLEAAGAHAREWEFRIIERTNPKGYEIEKIRDLMDSEKSKHKQRGCNRLHKVKKYQRFIEVCGELRNQGRWSHLHMAPRMSVLGHSMFVATVSYLFSLEAGACEKQLVNNFFLGLFHDLEETQTRDVRSPLKAKLPVIGETLEEISKEMMEKEVIQLLPPSWQKEFRFLCLTEPGTDYAYINESFTQVKKEQILSEYNYDEYNPFSGSIVKAADNLGAFLESAQAVKNGCGSPEVQSAVFSIAKNAETVKIGRFDLGLMYRELSI